ncbi:MAG: ABC transporter ATP-binding protein [Olsenella sp.]
MIRLEHVSKSYDGGRTRAVSEFSIEIPSGQIFGLLGPNGAGKSTLLNMIVGVLSPDAGRIEVDGIDLAEDPIGAKRHLCYVSDSPDHLLRLRGYEYLRFVADVYGVPEDIRATRATMLVKRFGMEGALERQLLSYSHGMRQKMMVIGALLPDPNVWILDEPMVGLDPRAARTLKDSMRAHADAGRTVLFSTHVLDVAERIVDRVGVIAQGELIFQGSVDDLHTRFSADESLEDMFLELTEEDSPFRKVSAS